MFGQPARLLTFVPVYLKGRDFYYVELHSAYDYGYVLLFSLH